VTRKFKAEGMKEKKIYLLFTDTGTLLTKLIKLYTKKPFNHVSLSFDYQLTEIFSFGRKKHYNPFTGGFVSEKLGRGLFKKARCEVYSYTISEMDYDQMIKKVRQMEAEKDLYKYNFIGLFAIILNLNFNRKNAFFCSQFVATIISEKMDALDKIPCLVTPQDLMNLDKLQLVYKGELNYYPPNKKELMENTAKERVWKQIISYTIQQTMLRRKKVS
jgi:hypothetical protein